MAPVHGSPHKIPEPIKWLEEWLIPQLHACFHLLNIEINESLFIQTIILVMCPKASLLVAKVVQSALFAGSVSKFLLDSNP